MEDLECILLSERRQSEETTGGFQTHDILEEAKLWRQ